MKPLLPCLVIGLLAPAFSQAREPCRAELRVTNGPPGEAITCPLEHTNVVADIQGFIARVTVRQVFGNPLDRKIEAVYVFPLSQNAAVDHMVMEVGDRRVIGQVLERAAAREVYEQAVAAGHVAGLLDQERPNIFTQSVANIEPGAKVVIEISYVEVVRYEDGKFEWVFPMVVGPRYIPGGGSAPAPMTRGQGTSEVPDAGRITPPVIPEGLRAGHDVSLSVRIDSGAATVTPDGILSETHAVAQRAADAPGAVIVELQQQATIPNKDFVLRYALGGDQVREGCFVSQTPLGTYFTLILQPPARVVPSALVPRDLIFVLDTSGSMHGYPIEKAKEVMGKAISGMRPGDTFNLITFSGDTRILWPAPRPNTPENRAEAQKFLASRRGGGATEMMKAIDAALRPTATLTDNGRPGRRAPRAAPAVEPVRIVMFMTDGYVGNDMAIIDAVRQYAGTTRVFSFGVGSSVNRFLLDGLAREGRGEVEYVLLESQAEAAVERFHERIAAPVLTDIQIDWGNLPVAEVYPRRIPDLFAARPLVIHGRLSAPGGGTVTLTGNTGAGRFERRIPILAPMAAETPTPTAGGPPPDAGLLDPHVSLWARSKADDLLSRDWAALQADRFPEALKQQVVELGVQFRILTQFTSFVAVEEMRVTIGGEPTTIHVPVEMPQGVSYQGVFDQVAVGADMAPGKPARRVAGSFGSLAGRPVPTGALPAGRGRGEDAKEAGITRGREEAAPDEDGPPAARPKTPQDKLAAALRGLAARVEKDGRDGNLAIDKLRVLNWRVDVLVSLQATDAETLEALKALGFEPSAESKTVRLLVGSIDVRRLDELAKLDAVVAVRPAMN